jgi:hypothetical protein
VGGWLRGSSERLGLCDERVARTILRGAARAQTPGPFPGNSETVGEAGGGWTRASMATSIDLRFMVSSTNVEFVETASTSTSIGSLKAQLMAAHADAVKGASSADEIVLIFGGRFLSNNEKIAEINGGKAPLEDRTTLHVMVRPKGAAGSGRAAGRSPTANNNARGCCVVM